MDSNLKPYKRSEDGDGRTAFANFVYDSGKRKGQFNGIHRVIDYLGG